MRGAMLLLRVLSQIANRTFVLIVLLAALWGYLQPGAFLWVSTSVAVPWFGEVNGIIVGLGLIMLGMGMTLSWDSVRESLSHPSWIFLGTLSQFLVMSTVAFLLVTGLGLPDVLAAGVLLVGCCPGGTASNVIAFLARADVSLSVAITLVSTLLSPLVTPWLMWFFAQELLGYFRGTVIDVPVVLMMKTIVVVVVPILLGFALKQSLWGEEPVPRVKQSFTLLSIVVIALIVGFVVGNAHQARQLRLTWLLILPVVLHNLFGLIAGYGIGALYGLPVSAMRTLSIEVGMQNSGLAVALSGILAENLRGLSSFEPSELALIAIPAVMFSVWHNVTGPLLASWWSRTAGAV